MLLLFQIVGYLAVYRLCFAMSLFFFVMALLMVGVKSSKDPRAAIQNGYDNVEYYCVFIYLFIFSNVNDMMS